MDILTLLGLYCPNCVVLRDMVALTSAGSQVLLLCVLPCIDVLYI